MWPQPDMHEVAEAVVAMIETSAPDAALVLGSLPPAGRDLDLLVRRNEERALAARFEREGMLPRANRWILFRNCSAYRVELVAADGWRAPPSDELFADAIPLEGRDRLVRPAPHHAVLILATRITAGRALEPKHVERVRAAEREDPELWHRAESAARRFQLEPELDALRRALNGHETRPAVRHRRRRRRGHVVAISGLDGAGKTSQAVALVHALERTGRAAAVEHVPLGSDWVLWAIGGTARRLVSTTARVGVFAGAAERTSTGASILGDPSHPATGGGPARRAATQLWAAFVAGANAFTYWRTTSRHLVAGRVVVQDRYTLDSVVRLETLYGGATRMRLQRWLLARLSTGGRSSSSRGKRSSTGASASASASGASTASGSVRRSAPRSRARYGRSSDPSNRPRRRARRRI
jgi:hypothetical protein